METIMWPNTRVAIVGCGSIGSLYARILSEIGCQVLLHDNFGTKAKDLVDEIDATEIDNLSQLLAEAPDFIIVATPPKHHLEVAIEAMEHQIPLLIEKPLAHSIEGAETILAAANRTKSPAFCVCNMRYHKGVSELRKSLHLVGQPLYVRAHFGHRLSQMRPQGLNVFASEAKDGGGVIMDCIHEIDYLQSLFGPLSLTSASTKRLGPDPVNAEDWALIHMTGKEDMPVICELDFFSRMKHRGCEITGTEGSLIWQSVGRRPEVCNVLLWKKDEEKLLLSVPSLNPKLEYLDMLTDMLNLIKGQNHPAYQHSLQSLDEAARALTIASTARKTFRAY